MKKLYFLIIALSITCSAFSQAYKPMLSNSSEWYYFEIGFNPGTTHFAIDGDTLLSGLLYRKITETRLFTPSSGITAIQTHYLREDSVARKVYFIDWNGNVDLLYDYNLLPGDTFELPLVFGGGQLVLDSISYDFSDLIQTSLAMNAPGCIPDSSNLDFVSPKIFHFGGVIWIEGIGCLSHLMETRLFGCYQFLSCHFDDNAIKDFHISSWQNQLNYECISFFVGIDEKPFNEGALEIYPNPANGESITIDGDGLNLVELYNIQGQLIKTVEVKNDKVAIDLNKQLKGIYFVKAQFKNGAVTTKKLIIN